MSLREGSSGPYQASADRSRRYDRRGRKAEVSRKALIKTHVKQKTRLGADDPRLARDRCFAGLLPHRTSGPISDLQIRLAPSGEAVAIWSGLDGTGRQVEAATRPAP
jgi:hypothetical protein